MASDCPACKKGTMQKMPFVPYDPGDRVKMEIYHSREKGAACYRCDACGHEVIERPGH